MNKKEIWKSYRFPILLVLGILIATLGFLFDPAATCLNASGDAIASMMVSRIVEGKEWITGRFAGGTAD